MVDLRIFLTAYSWIPCWETRRTSTFLLRREPELGTTLFGNPATSRRRPVILRPRLTTSLPFSQRIGCVAVFRYFRPTMFKLSTRQRQAERWRTEQAAKRSRKGAHWPAAVPKASAVQQKAANRRPSRWPVDNTSLVLIGPLSCSWALLLSLRILHPIFSVRSLSRP
jgi:hypothetical protein